MNQTIFTTKVSTNLQTFIPKKVQQLMQIKGGMNIDWVIKEDGIEVKKGKSAKDIIQSTAGKGKNLYAKHSGGDNWLKRERENSWK